MTRRFLHELVNLYCDHPWVYIVAALVGWFWADIAAILVNR